MADRDPLDAKEEAAAAVPQRWNMPGSRLVRIGTCGAFTPGEQLRHDATELGLLFLTFVGVPLAVVAAVSGAVVAVGALLGIGANLVGGFHGR